VWGEHICVNAFWGDLQRGVQSCAYPILPGSDLHNELVEQLDDENIRPVFILGHPDSSRGFSTLAERLGGQIYDVPNDSYQPQPYVDALDALAEQLSSQYFVRYEAADATTTQFATVTVRPDHRWRAIGDLPPEPLVALEHIGGDAACPELLAVTTEGGVFLSSQCGTEWREGTASLSDTQIIATTSFAQEVAALSSEGAISIIESNGSSTEILSAGSTLIRQIAYDRSGRLWAIGGSANQVVFGWDTEWEPAWTWDVPISSEMEAAFIVSTDPAVCVSADVEHRVCRDVDSDDWRSESMTGLPIADLALPLQLVVVGQERTVVILANSDGGTYRSIDGGGTWGQVLDEGSRRRLEVIYGPRDVVCAASSTEVMCSEDEGRSWTPLGLTFLNSGEGLLTAVDQGFSLAQAGSFQRILRVGNRELPSANVFFDTDVDEPQSRMWRFLSETSGLLSSDPTVRLRIEAHADRHGTHEDNDGLALRRAHRVRDILIELGVDSERIDTESFGERRPVRSGHSEADDARNRRVELIMLRPIPSSGWMGSDCD
jgi:outer membrane protein OmpA-like peptidoglycan-associated protein